jgi:hypothetical protein
LEAADLLGVRKVEGAGKGSNGQDKTFEERRNTAFTALVSRS